MSRTARHRFRPSLEGHLESRVVLSTAASPVADMTTQVVSVALVSPIRISQRTLNTVNEKIDWAFQRYRSGNAFSPFHNVFDKILSGGADKDAVDSTTTDERGNRALLMKRIAPALARLPNGYNALYARIDDKAIPGVIKPSNSTFFRDWLKTQIRQYVKAGVRDQRFLLTAR